MLTLVAALACPDCPPAREARRWFLERDLGVHLLIAIAPFVVVLALVLAITKLVDRPGAPGVS